MRAGAPAAGATIGLGAGTPIEGAIVDELGRELNPPGSLTGISPALLAQYQAAVEATYQTALAAKSA